MMQLSRWKVILVVLATILGALFTLPNLMPAGARSSLPGFLPRQGLNLGLDLQGGLSVVLTAKGRVDSKILDQTVDIIRPASPSRLPRSR